MVACDNVALAIRWCARSRQGAEAKPQLFQYRQVQIAARLFGEHEQAADTGEPSMWLQLGGQRCTVEQAWGTRDPFYNFSSPAAQDFWLDQIVAQLLQDPSLVSTQ